MPSLYRQLNQAGYVCSAAFASAVAATLATRPVAGAILEGPIGTGKSYLPEVLAGVLEADFFFYQCFPGTREEDLILKMLPSEDTVSGIRLEEGILVQAVASTGRADRQRVMLVLDEWDKTRPSADAFLLDFLQSGRIGLAGRTWQADLTRLVVFLTVNNERELSEPLLRRLPKIAFAHLPTVYVQRALEATHPDHPFLFSALVLYERCLMAGLAKPATIQELRQLLDAVTTLGTAADWDALVFQFVTKSEEAHTRLQATEAEPAAWQRRLRARLDPGAYALHRRRPGPADDECSDLRMPRLSEARRFDDGIVAEEAAFDAAAASGIVQLTDAAYDAAVRQTAEPEPSAARLGDFAHVTGDGFLVIDRPLGLRDLPLLERLWGQNGEVCFVEPRATWEDVKALQQWAPLVIVKFSRNEILARAAGIDLRWTPQHGAEIIVGLGARDVFSQCFGRAWGALGEGRWLGRKGLIYQHYAPQEDGHGPAAS